MSNRKKKYKFNKQDYIEIVSYIAYTVAVYIMVYVQVNMDGINRTYQKAFFISVIAGIWLFRGEIKELTKEIIKANIILLISNIVSMRLGNNTISISNLVTLEVASIIYYVIEYVFVWELHKYLKLNGKTAYMEETGFFVLAYILVFYLNLNIYISFGISAIIFLSIGFRCYLVKVAKDKERELLDKEKKVAMKHRRKKRSFKRKKGMTGRR